MSDDTKGKIQEAVGWLTADREAEAKGRARQEGDTSDEAVEEAEKELRAEEYEEYDPDVDGDPVAKDVTPADSDPRTG
jgi:uncharacterized protein YjbJ (UPF0337 family)